jgi:colanic acid/amylovoran biosynthesis protein
MVEDRPFFILAGNGPYDNRGCEAIVRGTVKILREHFTDPQFLCISHFQDDQELRSQIALETDRAIRHVSSYRLNRKQAIRAVGTPDSWAYFFRLMFHLRSLKYQVYREMLPCLNEAAAVLSVGGDNYSLEYGKPFLHTDLDDLVLERQKPLVIWGASVGPFDKIPEYERFMIGHLKKITGIFARESVTVDYLAKHTVTENVYQVADPAFLMDPVNPQDTGKILTIDKDAIGINLSPLMAEYVCKGDLPRWERIAADIISSIAKQTSRPVYLIPHVITPVSDDFIFLKKVLTLTDPLVKNAVTLIPPDYNAAETKWIIRQMSLFAGARTHSTIAALSSGVPTLSFAYSIKSRGINRDIFGHEEYCLGPDRLNPEMVTLRIESMLADKNRIRNELDEKIPAIQKRALNAGRYLKDILA